MFDIGGLELLVIALVGLVVIGPKELPGALRAVSFWVRRARSMAREFQSGFEELTREAELDELKREVNAAIEENPVEDAVAGVRRDVENTIGPEIYTDLESGYPGSPGEEAPAPNARPDDSGPGAGEGTADTGAEAETPAGAADGTGEGAPAPEDSQGGADADKPLHKDAAGG